MELALLAILGHRSAHSLATGPVMADPFISPLLFTITPALSWHQASYYYMKDLQLNHLEVQELAILPPEGLPLPDHDCRHHFLSQLRLSLLHCGQNLGKSRTMHEIPTSSVYPASHHVPAAGGRQPVEPAPDAVDRDDVEVLAAGVVGAVHHGAHRARQRDAELGPRRSATSWSGKHILL